MSSSEGAAHAALFGFRAARRRANQALGGDRRARRDARKGVLERRGRFRRAGATGAATIPGKR